MNKLDETSSMNDSFIEHEQQVKEMFINGKIVTKVVYGKFGLISFLYHIFGLLNESQLKQVNYYFSLKEQLKRMQKSKE